MSNPRWKNIYTDKAGNKLFSRVILSRDTTEFKAVNRDGKIVTHTGALTMIRKAGYTNIKWSKVKKK